MSFFCWGLLTVVSLIFEMLTGTVALLFWAAGFALAGLAAFFDVPLVWQLLLCSLGMLAGVWAFSRKRRRSLQPDAVGLDVGQLLDVAQWDARGEAEVFYRGTVWKARWAEQGAPQAGLCRIAGIEGNVLLLQAR